MVIKGWKKAGRLLVPEYSMMPRMMDRRRQSFQGHRYWRVVITNTNDPNHHFIRGNEIAMRSTLGGANLLAGKTLVVTNGSFIVGNASSLNDGNLSTGESIISYAGTMPTTYPTGLIISCDFSSPVAVVEFGWYPTNISQIPLNFYIDYSDNNSVWQTSKSFSISGMTNNVWNNFS